MRTPFTIESIKNSPVAEKNKHLWDIKKKKRNKFGASKCEVDGIRFDSKKEAEYYKKLKILLKAGKIGLLERQVPFELNPGGTYSLKYLADFVFVDIDTGEKRVIDVKGFRTREYKKKKRLMDKVHGIKIIEK